MHVRMYVRMDVRMHVRIYVYMHVCVCTTNFAPNRRIEIKIDANLRLSSEEKKVWLINPNLLTLTRGQGSALPVHFSAVDNELWRE
jgi:hypothetical protein